MRQIQRLPCIALAALLVAGTVQAQQKPAAKAKPAAAEAKSSKAVVAAPKIEVVPETKDAGIVAKGQVIETTFVVKNSGGADLLISDARPGRGCAGGNHGRGSQP